MSKPQNETRQVIARIDEIETENNGSLSLNNIIISGVATPIQNEDVANKSYVDSVATSQPNQSITWSLQGILDEYDATTSISTIPLSSVVDGSISTNYPNVGALQELNTSVRTGNILSIPSTGWYSIRLTYSHPSLPILGGNAQEGLGSDCKIFIKINGSNRIPLGQEDSGAGITESISTVIDRYLTLGTTIEWEWDFGTAQINEDFFINASLINMTKSITLSNFSGASAILPGTQGIVPAPSTGQQFATLLGNGNWTNLAAPSIIDMLGSVKLDWTAKNTPSLLGINLAGSATYNNFNPNNYFINLVSGGSQTGYINFDVGQAYEYFKFEVYYKILNTTQPADVLAFFGCGTQVNTGNTGGLTFNTDYFNSASYNRQARFEDGAGNPLIGPYQITGYQDIDNSYYKMTMTRFEQNITVEIVGNSGKYTRTQPSFSPIFTGTRFGIFAQTGASSMDVQINSINLIAF